MTVRTTGATMVIAAMVIAAMACLKLLAQPAEPPSLLRDVLKRDSMLAILNPSEHLRDDYTIDELRAFGYWPPWVLADLDGDTQPDVAAAVVRRQGEQLSFGVLVVHAREPMRVHWIQRLGSQRAYGVVTNRPAGAIMPLHCIECDSNTWFRWSGRSYDAELYRPGEPIAIATHEPGARLGVFGRASRDSSLIVGVPACAEAIVIRVVGNDYETRWYLVELRGPKRVRGWIPASFASESECVG